MSKLILDISENNGYIDFEKVKQAGIEGVIIRIGWIGNKNNHTIDKYFIDYYNRAKNVGLKVGFYVFSYCLSLESIKSGCLWVENQIKGKSFDLPIFLDLEDDERSGTIISQIGKLELTKQAIYFCKYFESLGFKAGVYANKYWFENLVDVYQLEDYKIWLAEWNGKENPSVSYRVDLWQYSSDGSLPGINSRVDMNKCLCECSENQNSENEQKQENEDELEVKMYFNGSTKEDVYSDTKLTNKIGSLNPYEQCECLGIYQNRAIVRYKVDNKDNYKIGFAKWLGGVR